MRFELTTFPEVRWLLDMEPREVQLEALRRSYYGYQRYTMAPDNRGKDLRPEEPWWTSGRVAPGWGHFLEMRLGKTGTQTNEFELLRQEHDLRRMVVLSPTLSSRGGQTK